VGRFLSSGVKCQGLPTLFLVPGKPDFYADRAITFFCGRRSTGTHICPDIEIAPPPPLPTRRPSPFTWLAGVRLALGLCPPRSGANLFFWPMGSTVSLSADHIEFLKKLDYRSVSFFTAPKISFSFFSPGTARTLAFSYKIKNIPPLGLLPHPSSFFPVAPRRSRRPRTSGESFSLRNGRSSPSFLSRSDRTAV